jgi:CubicO group peptidase (beta-lactamase class C family)
LSPRQSGPIDQALAAAAAREVPGVVAMAVTDRGASLRGSLRRPRSRRRAGDDAGHCVPDCLDDQAVTSVAAMQLVERGPLTLDDLYDLLA